MLLLNEGDGQHGEIHLGLHRAQLALELIHLLLHGMELLHQLGDGLKQRFIRLLHARNQKPRLWSGLVGPGRSFLQAN
jgi:hypothetical protein